MWRFACLALAWPLIASTALADVAPVDPRAACRWHLFFVDDNCVPGPFQTCTYPNLVAADDACKAALAENANDDEVLFFRAVTRLLRIAEEQKDDPVKVTLRELMDQFGIADEGRSIHDPHLKFPKTTDPAFLGREDGSVDDRDPFTIVYLEPGNYRLAVSVAGAWEGQLLEGNSTWSPKGNLRGPVQIQDDGAGGCELLPIDHDGDYRVTFTGKIPGNVTSDDFSPGTTYVEGTLDRIDDDQVEFDWIRFTVAAADEVKLDLLSWECDPAAGPRDLNADGAFTSIDAQIFVFRDDEALWYDDLIIENSSIDSLTELPEGSPTGGDLQLAVEGLGLGVVEAIDASIADLEDIDDTIQIILTGEELTGPGFSRWLLTGDGKGPVSDPDPIEIDYGEVKLLQSALLLLKTAVNIVLATDLDLDIDELSPFLPALRIQMEIIDANANLFTRRSLPPPAPPDYAALRLEEAREANRAAIDAYFEGSAWGRAETDDQDDDLLTIEPEDRDLEAAIRADLADLRRSLDGRAAVLCSRSRWHRKRLEDLERELGTNFLGLGAVLDLTPFYTDETYVIRPVLPRIFFDAHEIKNYVANGPHPNGSYPDPERRACPATRARAIWPAAWSAACAPRTRTIRTVIRWRMPATTAGPSSIRIRRTRRPSW
jgi:hypothetical protein